MTRYEVFDYRNGDPLYVVRWLWLARLLKRRSPWLDYARPGDGWVVPDADAAALGFGPHRENTVCREPQLQACECCRRKADRETFR